MCGFVGIVGENDRELIRRMADVIGHRGPDGAGDYCRHDVSLGHRRLAIIDLDGGAQPMATQDERFVLVFNGEIYNHESLREELERAGRRFRTRCDSEVILEGFVEWGPAVVERLRGMFAFAIWDARERTCFLARDHMGIKPLYYGVFDGRLYFGSEIKAILEDERVPRRPDLAALDVFLEALMYPADLTAFEGIRQLEAGHRMTVRGSDIRVDRYYRIEFPARYDESIDEQSAIDGALEIATETVGLRRMSDVPIGVFLSGGVDSSLVAALLARGQSEPIRTFSLVHGGEDAWLDEREYINKVVEVYGTNHTAIESDPEWYEHIPDVIREFDQPCTTSINSWKISELAAKDVKVVLTGTGGDEAFAGYGRYSVAMDGRLGPEIARSWARALVDRVRGRRDRETISTLADAFGQRNTYFQGPAKTALYGAPMLEAAHGHWGRIFHRHFDREDLPDGLARCLHVDQMLYLINNLNNNLDKVSMAHGLEARVPLVDHRFVEYANTISSPIKVKDGELKYVLKEAACRVLPREIIYRQKRGFGIPLKTWMKGPFGRRTEAVLTKAAIEQRGLFRWEEVERLLRATRESRADYSMKLWILMTVELWFRMYIDSRAWRANATFQELAA